MDELEKRMQGAQDLSWL